MSARNAITDTFSCSCGESSSHTPLERGSISLFSCDGCERCILVRSQWPMLEQVGLLLVPHPCFSSAASTPRGYRPSSMVAKAVLLQHTQSTLHHQRTESHRHCHDCLASSLLSLRLSMGTATPIALEWLVRCLGPPGVATSALPRLLAAKALLITLQGSRACTLSYFTLSQARWSLRQMTAP